MSETTNFNKEVFTISELMEYLSMSKGTIMRLVRDKVFTAKKLKGVRGRTFFLKSEVIAAMQDKDELQVKEPTAKSGILGNSKSDK